MRRPMIHASSGRRSGEPWPRPDIGDASRSARPSARRGYALLLVVVLLAAVSGAVVASLDATTVETGSTDIAQQREQAAAAVEHGLHLGLAYLRQLDAGYASDPRIDYDIFGTHGPVPVSLRKDLIGPFEYPASGPDRGRFRIRVGMRPVQRARPPSGEDVRSAYGQVVELQVAVDDNPRHPARTPIEERASIGVLVPRRSSHAR